ncbi:MAG: hypothetical protein R3313_04895, partial [Candidatus Saccharimonadales bacterium]|nr:hypothetical protein [Candidatus Saccharimonadales bacterium]
LPHASYDLCEEKLLTSTYTVATVYGGLQAAARIAEQFGYPDDAIRWQTLADDIRDTAHEKLYNNGKKFFYKGFLLEENGMLSFDETIDVSSLFGAVVFGLYDNTDPYVLESIKTLENTLVNYSPSKGVPRYEHDQYHTCGSQYLGNPWPVTTLWLAQLYIDQGQPEKAEDAIAWAHDLMLKSGILPEQIHPDTSTHLSVQPLIWSQAEFMNTVLDLVNNKK